MSYPILAPRRHWFAPNDTTITRSSITEVEFVDSYTPTGNESDSWDASEAKDGSVKVYVNGTKLTIAGNGSGRIYANPDSGVMFCAPGDRFTALAQIVNISLLDTSNATKMDGMFGYCESLASLDLSTFDTSSCEDMAQMFYHCTSLTSLDLSKWDVSKVKTMAAMFHGASGYDTLMNLTSIDVTGWDVSSCEDMQSMFAGCKKIKTINIHTWTGTSACKNMGWMFWGCNALERIDLSKFDTSNVVSFHHLFAHNGKLSEVVGIADLNVGSAVTLNAMLHSTRIQSLDISKWDTHNVEDMSQFLEYNTAIVEIVGLEKIDTSKLKSCGSMFGGCTKLKELNLSTFDTTQVSANWVDPYRNANGFGMTGMFSGMTKLERVILGDSFSFDGDGSCSNKAVLPIPTSEFIPETNGVWYNAETLEGYDAANIPNRTAAIYVCVPIDVLVKHTTLIDFADAVRKYSNTSDKMTPSDAVVLLNDAIENNADYTAGYAEGRKAEYDAFWDVFQNYGKPMSYQHAFSQGKFTDENYNPKYPLRFDHHTVVGGQYVFYASPITDTKVDIIAGNNRPLSYCFQGCANLHTIRKLVLNGTNTFGNTFTNCTSLTNIVIEGTIEKSIDFQHSPLSRQSIESVFAALSADVTGQTATFNQAAVNAAFTTDGWNALIAPKSNWSFTLI